MKNLSSNQIRQAFLDFFNEKGHTIVESSSLVPQNDPTLLFANAGMNQFKDFFLGNQKPTFTKATSSQKCVRAGGKHNDLENVGYTARHHTFFEMLGNFSFGDYFKKEAIQLAWELLTVRFKIPEEKLLVTVYHEDTEAYDIWKDEIKISSDRIIKIGDKSEKYFSDNFWMMGDTGPCGPCSEIFYDHGSDIPGGVPGSPEEDGDRFIEIWNLVFMQFNRDKDGKMHPLPKPSVDTGMGLERISAVLQHVHANYEIDLFTNLISDASKITSYGDLLHPSLRVISDHIRSIVFLINDGVIPSNDGRGYVLRRIMRRAIRHGYKLGMRKAFLNKLAISVKKNMGDAYPDLNQKIEFIESTIFEEEERFFETIENGMNILETELLKINKQKVSVLSGKIAFKLHDTFGFPVDLTADICREQKIEINMTEFDDEMKNQRTQARQFSKFKSSKDITIEGIETKFLAYEHDYFESTITHIIVNDTFVETYDKPEQCTLVLLETPFYAESGGQVGDTGIISNDNFNFKVLDTQKTPNGILLHIGELISGTFGINQRALCQVDQDRRNAIKRNHSATHLLHRALKTVLGDHIQQKGSLVDEYKTRFDFSHPKQMTDHEIKEVENIVNNEILNNQMTEAQVMPLEDAKKSGAMMLFGEKYANEVRVLTIGNSKELCGGTHVKFTGDIGLFKISQENGVSSGVRRIEGTTGKSIIDLINRQDKLIDLAAKELKTSKDDIPEKLSLITNQLKESERIIHQLKLKIANESKNSLIDQVQILNGINTIITQLDNIDVPQLKTMMDNLKDGIKSGVIILASVNNEKINIIVGVTKDMVNRYHAGKIASSFATMVDGKGGGKPDMAMAGGSDLEKLSDALVEIKKII